MKFFSLALAFISLSASAQQAPFRQVHEAPEKVDYVRFMIERNRCQVSYNGEIKRMEVYQTLGNVDPRDVSAFQTFHDLSVFEGSKPYTITLKLIEWMPRSRRVVIKVQYDLPIDGLKTQFEWTAFDRVKVDCI